MLRHAAATGKRPDSQECVWVMSNVMRSNEGEDGENRCSVDELRQGPSGGGSSNHINMDLVTDVELHEDYDMITTSTSKGLKGDLAGADVIATILDLEVGGLRRSSDFPSPKCVFSGLFQSNFLTENMKI
ncbi:hypothetical protein F2P81_015242 [Scophthalmus maximus]|uniref:Uncharacterized protein n=1 Tax=Scophthalmus maximus TaxID=52904 RepID=A0A6A4SRK9_SCOMX|nr:hypothetical protein F2P81_015242 [Scophthalmus maximus]